MTKSFDDKFYICDTCCKKTVTGKNPCQAVCIKLQLYDFPNQLEDVQSLEKVLIVILLLFKKLTIMPKGQGKGAICNISVDVVDTCNTLSRAADRNGLVVVKITV